MEKGSTPKKRQRRNRTALRTCGNEPKRSALDWRLKAVQTKARKLSCAWILVTDAVLAKRPRSDTSYMVQFFLQHSDLRDIYEKVEGGGRISEAEALRLFESKDLNVVGAIADLA